MTLFGLRVLLILLSTFLLFLQSAKAQQTGLIPTPTPLPPVAPKVLIYQLDSDIPNRSTLIRPLFLVEGKINLFDEYGVEVCTLGRMNFLKTDYNANVLFGESIGIGVGLTHEYAELLPYVSAIASTDGQLNHRFTRGRNSTNLHNLSQPSLINLRTGLRYEGEWSTPKWNGNLVASLECGFGAADYGDRAASGILSDLNIQAALTYALNPNDFIKLATRFHYQQIQEMGVSETSARLSFLKDQFFIGGSEVGVEWREQNIDGLGRIRRISGTFSVGIR